MALKKALLKIGACALNTCSALHHFPARWPAPPARPQGASPVLRVAWLLHQRQPGAPNAGAGQPQRKQAAGTS